MHRAINAFRANIGRVKALGGLYDAVSGLTTPVVDASDMLRAEIAMAVSALDHYIHEMTRIGMLQIVDGARNQTTRHEVDGMEIYPAQC